MQDIQWVGIRQVLSIPSVVGFMYARIVIVTRGIRFITTMHGIPAPPFPQILAVELYRAHRPVTAATLLRPCRVLFGECLAVDGCS